MLAMVHSARRACSVYPSSGLKTKISRSHLGPQAKVVRKTCGSDRACEHEKEDRIGGGAGPGQLRTDLPGSLWRVARVWRSNTLRSGYLLRSPRVNGTKATQVWYRVQHVHLGIEWHDQGCIDHWYM